MILLVILHFFDFSNLRSWWDVKLIDFTKYSEFLRLFDFSTWSWEVKLFDFTEYIEFFDFSTFRPVGGRSK